MTLAHFDAPEVQRRNEATRSWLDSFLLDLIPRLHLRTALDVGCGYGLFSRYLRDLGLQVTGLDARAENVEEATRRHPGITFIVADIEDPSITRLGRSDLVLCLGVLHHLENPLRAMRNLRAVTGSMLVIETMIAPFGTELAALYEEDPGPHQALHYLGIVPAEPWTIKLLYRSGFPYVYRAAHLPRDGAYHGSWLRRRRRTVLVATQEACEHSALRPAPEPESATSLMWYRSGIGALMRRPAVRALVNRFRPPKG